MERKNKEKSRSFKNINNENEDISPQLKKDKLWLLTEINVDEKLQKLFVSKKFSIGNQFDQKGSEQFLSEKDECLKLMNLDDIDNIILETKTKTYKKNKRKSENKNKVETKNLYHDKKYIHRIKIVNMNDESFFSTESSKQTFKEFVSFVSKSKSNKEK